MDKIKTSALPISWVYALVIIYASLYPFSGWRDQSIYPWGFLWAPFPLYWTVSDVIINILGYIPFGFFLTLADLRVKNRDASSLSFNWIFAICMSLLMESLQTYLPARVPSSIDFLLNSLGVFFGVGIAYFCETHQIIDAWNQLRSRWLINESVGPLACLITWPLAIIYPPSIPFLMGDMSWGMKKEAYKFLGIQPHEEWMRAISGTLLQMSNFESTVCVATGLSIPIFLAFSIAPVLIHRVWVVFGVCFVGACALMLTSALTFDTFHIFSWFSMYIFFGFCIAIISSLMLSKISTQAAQVLLFILLLMHLFLPNDLSSDVYLAQSIQVWEQGKNARYIGLTQWVGLLWPYILLVVIAYRLIDRKVTKIYPDDAN